MQWYLFKVSGLGLQDSEVRLGGFVVQGCCFLAVRGSAQINTCCHENGPAFNSAFVKHRLGLDPVVIDVHSGNTSRSRVVLPPRCSFPS